MKIRAGVVGAGTVAWKIHFPIMKTLDELDVVGVCDEDPDRLAAARHHWQCRGFAAWADLLDQCRLDALYVFLPPYAHGEMEIAAARRGIHLFIEKPVANSLEIATRVGEAVRSHGAITAVGYQWRYLDSVAVLRETLGKHRPALVVGRWLGNTPAVPWWRQQELSGGQLVEQATHLVDLTRYVCGEPRKVVAVGTRGHNPLPRPNTVHDATGVSMVFEQGTIAMFLATNLLLDPGLRTESRTDLVFYGANFVARLSPASLEIATPCTRRTVAASGNPFEREHLAFLRAVLTGDVSGIRCDYADAAATMALTLRALESLEREVMLDCRVGHPSGMRETAAHAGTRF